MKKILIIMTGGTICSVKGDDGKSRSNADFTKSYLEDYFRNCSGSLLCHEVAFEYERLSTDILSENMTFEILNELIGIFKKNANRGDLSGIIVLHGTDTLAYTSSFLSFALAGLEIPVIMVSSQLALMCDEDNTVNEKANGYANFCTAAELILNGILPNVYVAYRNEHNEQNGAHEPGVMLLHLGSRLRQCPDGSNNFHSSGEICVTDVKTVAGVTAEQGDRLYLGACDLSRRVLLIHPYTGMRYDAFCLDGYYAAVHGTYHSQSVCIGRPSDEYNKSEINCSLDMIRETDRPYSVLTLLDRCQQRDLPLFLAPCNRESFKYGTTANALAMGAVALGDMTQEAAYAKATLGVALGLSGDELCDFMMRGIDHESGSFSF